VNRKDDGLILLGPLFFTKKKKENLHIVLICKKRAFDIMYKQNSKLEIWMRYACGENLFSIHKLNIFSSNMLVKMYPNVWRKYEAFQFQIIILSSFICFSI
jgi:hypothetical protein